MTGGDVDGWVDNGEEGRMSVGWYKRGNVENNRALPSSSEVKTKCTRSHRYGKREARRDTEARLGAQNRQTKLLGKMCRPGCLRVSSRSSPLHQPSSGVAVTAMISPSWKSNSSSIVAR